MEFAAFFSSSLLFPLDLHNLYFGHSKAERIHALSAVKLEASVEPTRRFVAEFLLCCHLDLRDEPGGLESHKRAYLNKSSVSRTVIVDFRDQGIDVLFVMVYAGRRECISDSLR